MTTKNGLKLEEYIAAYSIFEKTVRKSNQHTRAEVRLWVASVETGVPTAKSLALLEKRFRCSYLYCYSIARLLVVDPDAVCWFHVTL